MRARETEVGMKMPMHVAAIGKKNSDRPKDMFVAVHERAWQARELS